MSKLNRMVDVVDRLVFEHSCQTFGFAGFCFNFKNNALAFVSNQKVKFKSAIFVKIIEFLLRFAEKVSNKIIENSSFIS